jgi:hypothetical protein
VPAATTEALAPDYTAAILNAGRTLREPGVYFGLPWEEYLDDAALGSSAMVKLATEPADFWFESKFNPLWEHKDPTPDQLLGTAYHTAVLEGREAFERRYAIKHFSWATNQGKAERAQMEAAGKLPVGIDQWSRIQQAGAVIRSNPYLGEAFVGGVASEVSIFWVANGIPKKCRIDYFKARASVDFKTIANEYEIKFPQACRNQIARYEYLVQAEHYREGRGRVWHLLADGCVYGDHDAAAFKKAAATKEFAWVWVFLQKTRSPLTWGKTLSPGNPSLRWAREARIDLAEANWHRCVEKFGFHTPWLEPEPLTEFTEDDWT